MISRKVKLLKFIFVSCILLQSSTIFADYPSYESYRDSAISITSSCSAIKHKNGNEFLQNFWVNDLESKCGGFFQPYKNKFANEFHDHQVHFKADSDGHFSSSSPSYLSGNVNFSYKGISLEADKVCYVPHSDKTERDIALAVGDVRFAQNSLLVTAEKALWYISGGNYLKNTSYMFITPKIGVGSVWGRADEIWADSPNEVSMKDATFSFCGYKKPDWEIEAGYLDLNTLSKQGFATNIWLRLFGSRIFYMPIISFPLTSKRQTGFLYPHLSYNSAGYNFSFPFYWNLAPNYDLTTAFTSYAKRGLGYVVNWRLLTEKSKSEIDIFQVFRDTLFKKFKSDTAEAYAGSANATEQALVSELTNDSDNRSFFSLKHSYSFSDNLKLSANYFWLSDNYMRMDFPEIDSRLPEQKLPRFLSLNMDHSDWRLNFLWQDNKIIQVLNQDVIQGVFSAKPNINFAYRAIPNDFPNIEVNVNASFLEFAPASGSIITSSADSYDIQGSRSYIEPSIGVYSFDSYLGGKARLGFSRLWYNWHNSDYSVDSSESIFLPWVNIEKKVPLGYRSADGLFTLQSRLLYSYIPYKNQNSLPVIDTSLPINSYEQMFSINRFVGHDRIGDTNSVTMALENTWFKGSGDVKAKVDFGVNYAFTYHKVCLSDDCQEDIQAREHLSPWQMRLLYFGDEFRYGFILSLDNDFSSANSIYLDIEHDLKGGKAKFYYNYARYLSLYPMDLKRAKLLGFEFSQDFDNYWNTFANIQFNLEDKSVYGYFAGFRYKSCCIDLDFGVERKYIGENSTGSEEYQNNYVVKFVLSGLGQDH